MVRRSLARGGLNCDILPRHTGDAFLAALHRPEFDVILSDRRRARLRRAGALAAAHDHCPGVPFIVVSGFPQTRQYTGRGPTRWSCGEVRARATGPRHTHRPARHGGLEEDALETASYVWGCSNWFRRAALVARPQPAIHHGHRPPLRPQRGWADGASFILRDGENCFYVEEDALGPLWKGRRFPLSSCVGGWAMLNRQAAVIKDIYQDARIPHEAYRPTFVKSLVMMPIRTLAPVAAIGCLLGAPTQGHDRRKSNCCSARRQHLCCHGVGRLLSNLEQRVTERTSEMHRRSAQLEVLNKELEAFSYSVATTCAHLSSRSMDSRRSCWRTTGQA